ncbi:CLUMA_CG007294, isoform A, partial [Clunio marinus]
RGGYSGGGGRARSGGYSRRSSGGSYRPPSNRVGSAPSLGSGKSVGSNAVPHGPPPAYPGLGNRPVSSLNAPPPYSPGLSLPPSYNGLSRPSSAFGNSFGSKGLSGNTYISNNYYKSSRRGGFTTFLSSAIFYGVGMQNGYLLGPYNPYRHVWNDKDDREWRATTKAPYFENKVPGLESFLPAAAVVGAATAFGLASLLPLNVPENKPLMYCNTTEIAQTRIKLYENIYSCVNKSILISCPKIEENLSEVGVLPEKLAAFIPTTTTEAPEKVEKELSLSARIHVFFLKVIGKSDIIEKTTLAPVTSSSQVDFNETFWIPEPLTVPPEVSLDESSNKQRMISTDQPDLEGRSDYEENPDADDAQESFS